MDHQNLTRIATLEHEIQGLELELHETVAHLIRREAELGDKQRETARLHRDLTSAQDYSFQTTVERLEAQRQLTITQEHVVNLEKELGLLKAEKETNDQ